MCSDWSGSQSQLKLETESDTDNESEFKTWPVQGFVN